MIAFLARFVSPGPILWALVALAVTIFVARPVLSTIELAQASERYKAELEVANANVASLSTQVTDLQANENRLRQEASNRLQAVNKDLTDARREVSTLASQTDRLRQSLAANTGDCATILRELSTGLRSDSASTSTPAAPKAGNTSKKRRSRP